MSTIVMKSPVCRDLLSRPAFQQFKDVCQKAGGVVCIVIIVSLLAAHCRSSAMVTDDFYLFSLFIFYL